MKTTPWWQPKIALLLSHCYLAFLLLKFDWQNALWFVVFFSISAFGFGSLGHFINDWSDRQHDRASGKLNISESLTPAGRMITLVALLSVAFVPWLFLKTDYIIAIMLLTQTALYLLYSLKPMRLKERSFFGLLTDALYAYALPAVLVFYAAEHFVESHFDMYWYLIVFVWSVLLGVQNIIIHQIDDYENDIQSKTTTWVSRTGKVFARKILLYFVWTYHVFFFVVFVIYTGLKWNFWYITFPLSYLAIQFYSVFSKKSFGNYLKSNLSADLQKLNIHYHHFLPYWTLALLFSVDIKFSALLLLHLLLFNWHRIGWLFKNFIHPPVSKFINYSVYYFRRIIFMQNAEKAMREHYGDYVENMSDKQRRNTLPNIVLANSNINKYTETFVKKHADDLEVMGYYVHRLYGGNLPTAEVKTGVLLSNSKAVRKFHEWKEAFFDLGENYYYKKAFGNYLLNNNIRLVFAEFGTCGVEIFESCKEAGVPLIVMFHGYDVHHAEVLRQNRERYREMFAYASKIIGVSNDILQKLKEEGAPEDKLFYLPCSFNAEVYQYSDHSKNLPVFLSVGRFAETKSPHITILAFNEALKTIPDARLVMIGKDGGGELFEACHILVKALNIESKVEFKGILNSESVYAEMQKARALVQHSVTTPIHGDKEGTPVSVMEAMACGLPVIATRHAGIAEIIEHKRTGILVDEYDYLEMAKQMIRICQDDLLAQSLGKNASENISKNELIADNQKFLAALIETSKLQLP